MDDVRRRVRDGEEGQVIFTQRDASSPTTCSKPRVHSDPSLLLVGHAVGAGFSVSCSGYYARGPQRERSTGPDTGSLVVGLVQSAPDSTRFQRDYGRLGHPVLSRKTATGGRSLHGWGGDGRC